MDIWGILGIDSTNDITIIKKAYAKKLKIHHPEVDPEGYQRLREAYDLAVKYSKNTNKKQLQRMQIESNVDIPDEPHNNSDSSDINTVPHEKNNILPKANFLIDLINNPLTAYAKNSDFIKRAEALYMDFFSRIEVENWQALLNCDVMWDINNKAQLSDMFIDFLKDHRHLPLHIWKFLDLNFGWSEQQDNNTYNDSFIQYILIQLDQKSGLRFPDFKKQDNFDYEEYLDNRERAFIALNENNLKDALLFIQNAKELYQNDPDLLRMEVICYIRAEKSVEAISSLERLLYIDPGDKDAHYFRAIISHEKDKQIQSGKAIKNKAYNKSEYESRLLLLAKSYFKFGSLEYSKELLLNVLELNPKNSEAQTLLELIYEQLRSELLWNIEKDPNNEGLKHKLSLLKSEIYKKNKKYENKATSKIYLRIFLIGAACIIALFFLNNIFSNKKVTPAPPAQTAEDGIIPSLNETDLNKLPNTPQKVHVKFSSIKLLHVTSTEIKDGCLCIGNVNNKEIIFVTKLSLLKEVDNFDLGYFYSTSSIVNLGSYGLVGTLQDIPSSDMISAISIELARHSEQSIMNNLNTQKYIVIDGYEDNASNNANFDSFAPFLFVGLISLAGLIISRILRRTSKS